MALHAFPEKFEMFDAGKIYFIQLSSDQGEKK